MIFLLFWLCSSAESSSLSLPGASPKCIQIHSEVCHSPLGFVMHHVSRRPETKLWLVKGQLTKHGDILTSAECTNGLTSGLRQRVSCHVPHYTDYDIWLLTGIQSAGGNNRRRHRRVQSPQQNEGQLPLVCKKHLDLKRNGLLHCSHGRKHTQPFCASVYMRYAAERSQLSLSCFLLGHSDN